MSKKYIFSDVAEFISEKILLKSLSVEHYISTDNMLPNLGGIVPADKLPTGDRCNHFKKGDVLFSNIRTYFKKVWLAEFEGGCSADVLIVRSKDENIVLNSYLYLIMCSDQFIDFTNASSKGSKMPRGDKNAILKYEFELPPIHEQKELVNRYLTFNQKIQLNTQINQTLEQIAQAIFKSWFIDFAPVKAKAEAKAQGSTDEQANIAAMSVISGKSPDQLNAYKQSNPTDYQQLHQLAQAFPSEFEEIDGVEVPKGWGIEKIEDVIQKIPVGKKYSQKNVFEEGDIPVLDQGKSGIIGYHNDKAGVSASTDNPVIVFANHTCYMRLISYPFSAIQNVFAFKGKEVDVFWLYLATLGKQEFTEYKGHFPDFLIKQIVVPNKEMTFSFSQFISENFMKIFSNDEENKHLSKLRDLLLPKLLSGEVVNV